mmetsp:Transcript_25175/g.87861  ORF Transcript_25175/g.87861 Transcript_25175/m.87861 type:complete len:250 (+) Transcript_25175:416-1165(+)
MIHRFAIWKAALWLCLILAGARTTNTPLSTCSTLQPQYLPAHATPLSGSSPPGASAGSDAALRIDRLSASDFSRMSLAAALGSSCAIFAHLCGDKSAPGASTRALPSRASYEALGGAPALAPRPVTHLSMLPSVLSPSEELSSSSSSPALRFASRSPGEPRTARHVVTSTTDSSDTTSSRTAKSSTIFSTLLRRVSSTYAATFFATADSAVLTPSACDGTSLPSSSTRDVFDCTRNDAAAPPSSPPPRV